MKDNFFKSLRDNVKNALTFQDADEYYDDEEYVDEEEDVVSEPEPKQSAPTYQTYDRQPGFQAAAYQPYGTIGTDTTEKPVKAKKANTNIYSMSEAKPMQKLKVALFVLEDMDDARNVADCMIDRAIVTICDMTKISIAEERRVLDFLDGVKYVCKSKIENISDHIYLIVPEAAELSGDFFSQVDSTSFYG